VGLNFRRRRGTIPYVFFYLRAGSCGRVGDKQRYSVIIALVKWLNRFAGGFD